MFAKTLPRKRAALLTKVKKRLISDSRRLASEQRRTPCVRIQADRALRRSCWRRLAVGLAAPALAGARHHDRVYADSFGNLVIDSAAGYKRILVGEGKLAKELSDYTSAGQPEPK